MLNGSVGYERGLDTLTVAPAAEVDPALFAALQSACRRLFERGWQPGELHRVVGRRGTVPHTVLVTDAVAAHLRGFRPATVDPRWRAQADALGATVWWPADNVYFDRLPARWRVDRIEILDTVLVLLGILRTLPAIEVLIPVPGTAVAAASSKKSGSKRAGAVDVRMLDRVRALLAKAESTTYPAEAETYTAKAQELVARHSIDEALLVARSGADGAPSTVVPFARRIGVDHPYESEKASLLDAVARANRCHAVWSPELGFATVFGFDSDIDAVDLLHTSLLVQANRAMSAAEPLGVQANGKAGRARLKTFRQSFLVGFAVRIGERLTRASEAAVAEAAAGAGPGEGPATAAPQDLLPVLAARDAQVRETMERVFPRTVRGRGTRVDSDEGWDSGRAAADRVALHQEPRQG
ncbi:DUF2786 domain-containing protein [Dactylosporangium siamense]|uniref:DUF2786 domain-containing protein n=1 Tax=Dactylosporangium siamense TaxID=685454 RepID=A0A919PV54_9ACTN|nr:hypothetical protein Dsi01nite_094460 [Dactylosporangium siamense]